MDYARQAYQQLSQHLKKYGKYQFLIKSEGLFNTHILAI